MLYRKPIFDIKIKAQRRNPFNQLAQNENAKELFQMGVFNPEAAQMVLPMLEMMEFEGIENVKEQVQQGATLLNQLQQAQQQIAQLTAIIAQLTGAQLGTPEQPSGEGAQVQSAPIARSPMGRAHDSTVQKAQENYAETLAARA